MSATRIGVLLLVVLLVSPIATNAIVYVHAGATGANDGTSWTNAFDDLSTALSVSPGFSEIWIAEGVYRPSGGANASFVLTNGMRLYGGFQYGDTAIADRDWLHHRTVLNGDIDDDDAPNWANRLDNSRSVVRIDFTDAPTAAVLDGLIIVGGNANAEDVLNTASFGGGININWAPGTIVSNCVVASCSASGGGGIYIRRSAGAQIANSVFSGNRQPYDDPANDFSSGAISGAADDGYPTVIRHCRFAGNTSVERGGVTYTTHKLWDVSFANCLMVGNTAPNWAGGALYLRNLASSLVNCTFAYNTPDAIHGHAADANVDSCIFWDSCLIFSSAGGALNPVYSDLQDPAYAGTNGNINTPPAFVLQTTGNWTGASAYDPDMGLTTLTDATRSWVNGELSGGTLNPNNGQALHYMIYSNTPTTVLVWGDATAGSTGNPYGVYDWHLDITSPCIDTGNPALDWSLEPDYPQGRINMGAYGNSVEAGTTNPPTLTLPSGLRLVVY